MPLDLLIRNRQARVGIIGLGYVGLPLMREFCGAGFTVTGFDIDTTKIDTLKRGESYIAHIPAEVTRPLVADGKFIPTANFDELARQDAIIICVPTPLTKQLEPDLSFIEKTAEAIAPRLRTGQLIVLESTTYPGTTREIVKPILERRGLRAGKDFHLAFSPEREDPGNQKYRTGTIPKVVGGLDPESGRLAGLLYGSVVTKVIPVRDADTAEAVKILENIYRCVNIALVNELKVLFDKMGIDTWEVIDAAATKPFGFQAFYPGPGLGGHCIPIDPFYLSWKAREYETPTRFIELAGEVNQAMPEYCVRRLMDTLSDHGKATRGARVLVLGVAYKRDVDDVRESPSLKVISLLQTRGAQVDYHDPHVPSLRKMRHYDLPLSSVPLTPEALRGYDAVMIVTDHAAVDYDAVVRHARIVIDTRNATRNVKEGREKIVKA